MRDVLAMLDQRVIALTDHARHLAYSPDGATLAVATHEGRVLLFDLEAGAVSSHRGLALGLVWSRRGLVAIADGVKKIGKRRKRAEDDAVSAVAATAENGRIMLYDGDAVEIGGLASVGYRPVVSGGTLAAITREHVEVYDAQTRTLRIRHAIDANEIALSPDGSRLLARCHVGAWEGPSAGPLTWYPERGALAHDGERFALGAAIYRVGCALPELRLPVQQMEAIAFAPGGTSVAIANRACVRIVDLEALAAWPAPVGPETEVASLAVDPERRRIAAIDKSGLVCVWRDAALEATWRVCGGVGRPIAFARDGHLLVGTYGLEVWDVATRERRAALPIAGLHGIAQIATSERCLAVRDSERIAILELDYTLRTLLGATDSPLPQIEAIALAPRGHRLGVARRNEPALLLDPADGSTVRELPSATAIAIGETLVACSTYQSGTLIALDTEGEVEEVVPFTSAIAIGDAFLWHADRRVGLRARHDVRLDVQYATQWDAVSAAVASDRFLTSASQWIAERTLADGRLRRVLASGAQGKITSLAFDPSGEHLAAGEYNGRLQVWRLGPAPVRIGLLDGTTLQPARTIREPGQVGEIRELTFTASELIACAAEVFAWPISALASIGTTEPRALPIIAHRISRDGSRILAGRDWNTYEIHAADGTKLSTGGSSNARDRFDDLSDDGRLVLFGGALETASELTVLRDTGESMGTLRIDGHVELARFDSRGQVVGALSNRGPFFRWDPIAGRVERWCEAPPIDLISLKLVARAPGRIVLEAGSVHIVIEEVTGAILATIAATDDSSSTAAALSADGRQVAIGNWSGQVRVYDLDPAHPNGARCVAALAGTGEGGWWAIGAEGVTHAAGDAVTRDWSAE